MQAIALSRTLQRCSPPWSAAALRGSLPSPISGLRRLSHRGLSRLLPTLGPTQSSQTALFARNGAIKDPAEFVYPKNRALHSTTASETGTGSADLSIASLQNLSPNQPYVFTSQTNDPHENLAIEHHLLTYSHPHSHILFTYQNTPCVVIGRNQNPWTECNLAEIAKGLPKVDKDGIFTEDNGREQVQLVRRRSGGGAVFHDLGNLNYTVIVPNDPKEGRGFERRTHVEMVVEALKEFVDEDSSAQIAKLKNYDKVKANERNDIVMTRLKEKQGEESASADRKGQKQEEWLKVSGTAFKLTRGRALHHGTLLFSSPYIASISPLLNSPGREFITAKGVESVRSPVANLFGPTNYVEKQELGSKLRTSIHDVWRRTLNPNSEDDTGVLNAEIFVSIPQIQRNFSVPELAAGIDELKSESWKWDQTPGFSFDSGRILSGQKRELGLKFEAKNGIIQSTSVVVNFKAEELSRTWTEFFDRKLMGTKLHLDGIDNRWRRLLWDYKWNVQLRNKLCLILEKCFPSSLLRGAETSAPGLPTAGGSGASAVERWKGKKLERKSGEVLETESQGENAVEEEIGFNSIPSVGTVPFAEDKTPASSYSKYTRRGQIDRISGTIGFIKGHLRNVGMQLIKLSPQHNLTSHKQSEIILGMMEDGISTIQARVERIGIELEDFIQWARRNKSRRIKKSSNNRNRNIIRMTKTTPPAAIKALDPLPQAGPREDSDWNDFDTKLFEAMANVDEEVDWAVQMKVLRDITQEKDDENHQRRKDGDAILKATLQSLEEVSSERLTRSPSFSLDDVLDKARAETENEELRTARVAWDGAWGIGDGARLKNRRHVNKDR